MGGWCFGFVGFVWSLKRRSERRAVSREPAGERHWASRHRHYPQIPQCQRPPAKRVAWIFGPSLSFVCPLFSANGSQPSDLLIFSTSFHSGRSAAQSSVASGQRVRKRQPEGGLIGEGTSPSRIILLRFSSTYGSGIGTAESNPIV